MTEYHCDLAWLGGDVAQRDVRIVVEHGLITAVHAGAPVADRSTRLRGLTLPGLADAHSHAFHRALRGTTQAGGGSFWSWREQMYEVAATLEPDNYHLLARATFGEMVLAGITCVGEFHYVHHAPGGRRYADPNAMAAALVAAAGEAGVRLTLLDACYLHGGIDRPLAPVQQRFGDGDAGSWSERASAARSLASDTVRVGAAVHSVRAVDPASIAVVAEWAREHGAPLHVHVSEQPAENEQCLAAYGCTPTGVLDRAGALGPMVTAVHASHLTDDDVHLLGSSATAVCCCPTTERDLADGIAPTARLAAAGSPLTLGSDSHAVIDLLEEARAVEHAERLASLQRGNHRPAALLRAATVDGHRSLGWPDAGVIAVGAPADLVTVRLDSVRTAGGDDETALARVVFAGSPADVHHVVNGGRVVVVDGRHVALDVERLLVEAIGAIRGGGR